MSLKDKIQFTIENEIKHSAHLIKDFIKPGSTTVILTDEDKDKKE